MIARAGSLKLDIEKKDNWIVRWYKNRTKRTFKEMDEKQ
jgi:hypothetical protein